MHQTASGDHHDSGVKASHECSPYSPAPWTTRQAPEWSCGACGATWQLRFDLRVGDVWVREAA